MTIFRVIMLSHAIRLKKSERRCIEKPLGVSSSTLIRDGNLDPTRGYPARPDPNGPDFTRPDKE